MKKLAWQDWLCIGIPFLLFLASAACYGDWLIDDAGIGMAYARNLSQGYGLTSQPGMTPVEGYSDPLWIFLLTILYLVQLPVTPLTIKILASLLVLATFLVIYQALKLTTALYRGATLLALTFLALCQPYVMWCVSGLENPLYSLIFSTLVYQLIKLNSAPSYNFKKALLAGILVALLGLTRPEGVIFFLFIGVVVSILLLTKKIGRSPATYYLLTSTLGFAVIFGAYFLFRIIYFGDYFPNTFYAKISPPTDNVARPIYILCVSQIRRLFALEYSIPGLNNLACLLIFALLFKRQRQTPKLRGGSIWLIALAFGALNYIILPDDWMPQYRFATPVVLALIPILSVIVCRLCFELSVERRHGVALPFFLAPILGLYQLFYSSPEIVNYASYPVVPLQEVQTSYADRFNRYADAFNLKSASVLLPDLGGTLLYSHLRIYDLAGLCDKTIAQTLYYHNDLNSFHNYVFDVIRPTFIHAHDNWAVDAQLDQDPRFRRDYIPIYEYRERWPADSPTQTVLTGDYVLKSLAQANPDGFNECNQISFDYRTDVNLSNRPILIMLK